MYGLDRWMPLVELPTRAHRTVGVWVAVLGLVPAILAAMSMFRRGPRFIRITSPPPS
ncbi:MAG: hypothetical protein R3C97_07770 [Geminicoccaceae bacterium]